MSNLHVLVCNNRSSVDLLIAIHRLRYRVFKRRLDWEVAVSGSMEIDHYDIYNPTYLALVDDDRTLLGATRLLPTEGPNMLADTFPVLLHGNPAPRASDIWEVSRLCIDTERATARADVGLSRATHTLVAGIAEYTHREGVTQLAAVTDLTVERILRRAGCRVERLGEPLQIGKTKAVACTFEVSERAVMETRAAGNLPLDRSVLGMPAQAEPLRPAA